jgi:hypothetical protein
VLGGINQRLRVNLGDSTFPRSPVGEYPGQGIREFSGVSVQLRDGYRFDSGISWIKFREEVPASKAD